MSKKQISELDAMKTVNDLFAQIEDEKTRKRILLWTADKFLVNGEKNLLTATGQKKKSKGKKTAKKAIKKTKPLKIVGDLDLKPKGKKSLADFIKEKGPVSIKEKMTVATHYLLNELKIANVTVNHLYTCFKAMSDWRLPKDFINLLQQAGTAGLLDTSNRDDIKLIAIGENLVEHDLPREKKTNKK